MIKVLIILGILIQITFAYGSVLKTGQIKSYDQNGTEVTSGLIKDDGFYQKGKARSYTRSNAGVVRDNVTGLEWQDNTDPIDKPWVTLENYNDGNYNDTSGDTAATYCSEITIDGGGWRLPSIEELGTITDYEKYNNAVDEIFFQYTISHNYWSFTTKENGDSAAWGINGYYGSITALTKGDNYYVRCVRGDHLSVSTDFIRDNVKEIVTDMKTGLQWQDDFIDYSMVKTWKEALNYCEHLTLGYCSNWRLPNQNELLTIMDYASIHPSINGTFINTALNTYWSSTSFAARTSDAWIVYFSDSGTGGGSPKYLSASVRCVQGGEVQLNPSIIIYLLN